MDKPQGLVETFILNEIRDGDQEMFGLFRDLYGICYEYVGIDERTGEIYEVDV